MLWPEMDAALVTSGGGGNPPAAVQRPVAQVLSRRITGTRLRVADVPIWLVGMLVMCLWAAPFVWMVWRLSPSCRARPLRHISSRHSTRLSRASSKGRQLLALYRACRWKGLPLPICFIRSWGRLAR